MNFLSAFWAMIASPFDMSVHVHHAKVERKGVLVFGLMNARGHPEYASQYHHEISKIGVVVLPPKPEWLR